MHSHSIRELSLIHVASTANTELAVILKQAHVNSMAGSTVSLALVLRIIRIESLAGHVEQVIHVISFLCCCLQAGTIVWVMAPVVHRGTRRQRCAPAVCTILLDLGNNTVLLVVDNIVTHGEAPLLEASNDLVHHSLVCPRQHGTNVPVEFRTTDSAVLHKRDEDLILHRIVLPSCILLLEELTQASESFRNTEHFLPRMECELTGTSGTHKLNLLLHDACLATADISSKGDDRGIQCLTIDFRKLHDVCFLEILGQRGGIHDRNQLCQVPYEYELRISGECSLQVSIQQEAQHRYFFHDQELQAIRELVKLVTHWLKDAGHACFTRGIAILIPYWY